MDEFGIQGQFYLAMTISLAPSSLVDGDLSVQNQVQYYNNRVETIEKGIPVRVVANFHDTPLATDKDVLC